MKKITTSIVLILFVSMKIAIAQTPVYFNIISHNEISDSLDYTDSVNHFNYIKPLIKELCDTIISKKAKYNMQVDGNFINGVLNWDNGASNPNDILQWANSSQYIDIDGHNHFNPLPSDAINKNNPYKYPDLAKLLDSCGLVLAHNILGGVTYADTSVGAIVMNENWTVYSNPTPGFTFTNYLWQADIVWGTATPSHVADYTHFGVWKPAGGTSPTQFGTHDPIATLTHIGGGCKDEVSYILDGNDNLVRTTDEVIANIKAIADGIQTLPSSTNDFYTMNMLINFRDIPLIPYFADSLSKIIDGIRPYVDQGKIVWATLGEKYDLWYQQHTNPNDYFNVDCQDVPLVTSIESIEKDGLNSNKLYPNPVNDFIYLDNSFNKCSISIFDVLGNIVFNNIILDNQLNLSFLTKGVYVLVIKKEGIPISHQKIIKN